MKPVADRAELSELGATCVRGALSDVEVFDIVDALAGVSESVAGVRLTDISKLTPHLQILGCVGGLVGQILGPAAFPVRAVLFDKGPANNWSLGWHQDRTIAVRQRRETPGFGPWSLKSGLQHVAPPFSILEAMVTIRLHLDPVDAANAPLLIVPGSHRLGKLLDAEVTAVAERGPTSACLASPGDIWLYSTPIVHASKLATAPRRRRVLQVDYAAQPLPGDLEWLGI